MKVLYLMSQSRHTHDYLADFLLHGLYSVLGVENVYCWPEAENLHEGPRTPCVVCAESPYDTDQTWPRKNFALADALEQADVCVIAVQAGTKGMDTSPAAAWPRHKPIVAIDTGDNWSLAQGMDLQTYFRALCRRPLSLYFKREVPIGSHYALPLPLSYPAARAIKGEHQKDTRVFYHASCHNNQGPGLPRLHILNQLNLEVPSGQLDASLYTHRELRIVPEEYHRRMAKCLIGISWNGKPEIHTYDNNRLWENFAFGLAQVAERPTIRIPHAPVDGEHLIYVDDLDEIVPAVTALLTDVPRAIRIAQAGYAHFMQHHTSEARAAYLIDLIRTII